MAILPNLQAANPWLGLKPKAGLAGFGLTAAPLYNPLQTNAGGIFGTSMPSMPSMASAGGGSLTAAPPAIPSAPKPPPPAVPLPAQRALGNGVGGPGGWGSALDGGMGGMAMDNAMVQRGTAGYDNSPAGTQNASLAGSMTPLESALKAQFAAARSNPTALAQPTMVAAPSAPAAPDPGLARRALVNQTTPNNTTRPGYEFHDYSGSANPWGVYNQQMQRYQAAVDDGTAKREMYPGAWRGATGVQRPKSTWENLDSNAQNLIADSMARHTPQSLPLADRQQRVMANAMGVSYPQLQAEMITDKAANTNTLEGDVLAGSLTGALHPAIASAYQNRRGMENVAGIQGDTTRDVTMMGHQGGLEMGKQAGEYALKLGEQAGRSGVELQDAISRGDLQRVKITTDAMLQAAKISGASNAQIRQLEMMHSQAMQQAQIVANQKLAETQIVANQKLAETQAGAEATMGLQQGILNMYAGHPEYATQMPQTFQSLAPQMQSAYGWKPPMGPGGSPMNTTGDSAMPGMPNRALTVPIDEKGREEVAKRIINSHPNFVDNPSEWEQIMAEAKLVNMTPQEVANLYNKSRSGFFTGRQLSYPLGRFLKTGKAPSSSVLDYLGGAARLDPYYTQ